MPLRHQVGAEVRVAEAELAERARVARRSPRSGSSTAPTTISCARKTMSTACSKRLDVERAVGAAELHEVQRREVAGRVVDVHVLRARVRRVDAARVRARVPLVDRRVVLDARVGAAPRGLGDLAHQRRARRRGSPTGSPVVRAIRRHSPSSLDGVHELVGDADRVVGVLVLDRGEAVAVDRHVEAGVAQRVGLVLLARLAPDELADVRVVDVEHDHLGRAARLAARLDRAGPRVGAAHEGDRARGGAALAPAAPSSRGCSRG